MNAAVLAAFAVGIGTAIGWGRGGAALPLSVGCVISLIAAIALSRRVQVALTLALFALGTAAGASASVRSSAISDSLLPMLARQHSVVRACGTTGRLRPRSIEIRADVVERIRTSREPTKWRTSEPLRIAGDDIKRVRLGEAVCASGALLEAREGRDEAPLLAADKIRSIGTGSILRVAAGSVRERFLSAAKGALPPKQAGLLLGMTDGDVSLIDEETTADFRSTGLAHIVAVSGYNVAVFLAVVMLFVRAVIPGRRWLRVLVASPFLVFFAFLTGLSASVLRATVSAGIVLAATAGGRRTDGIRATMLAFVRLVLVSPDILFHPGFQLSFGATLGIVVWNEPLTARFASLLPRSDGKTSKAIAAGLATTIAAQIAVAPLLAWHFGRIPGVGAVANVVAIPLGGMVMVGGLITLGAASLLSFLDWMPAMMRLPLDAILGAARLFARVPGASLGVSVLVAVAATSAVAAVLARSARARRAAAACALVFGTASGGQLIAGSACDGRSIVALDVEQGTAILLRSGDNAVLVDGGPDEGGVTYDLEEFGVNELAAVFVSHPHADHTEGVVRALELLDVGRVIGRVTLPWRKGAEVIAAARRAGVPVSQAAAGDEFAFGDMRIEVVFPPPGPRPAYAEDQVHAHSLVLRAELGDVKALLPGDVGVQEEEELMGEDVAAEIFVAPHHGSKDLSTDFVDLVDPRLTLVSVGADNRYGHPAPEALAAYSRHGNVFRTDKDGSVMVCLTDANAEVTTTR